MTDPHELLQRMALTYGISKGQKESQDSFRVRVIYSVCAEMACASLWDETDDGKPVSVTHFKRRAEGMLNDFRKLYPELIPMLPLDQNESYQFKDEIYNISEAGGLLYHEPNRIAPAGHKKAGTDDITFLRGTAPGEVKFLSGIGSYIKTDSSSEEDPVDFFQLESETLTEKWNRIISQAEWKPLDTEAALEYMLLEPPFSQGYWQSKANRDGQASLCRTKLSIGPGRLYWIYKYENKKCFLSQLPDWQTEINVGGQLRHEYRNLSCACLACMGTLPEIRYYPDGNITKIELGYLLPPAEMDMLRLYSWPTNCNYFPSDFRRILATPVFEAIKSILLTEGYKFIKG